MEWVLIIMAYAGAFSNYDSVALESVPMYSEAACTAAGKKALTLADGTAKDVHFVCVKAR